MKLVGSPSVCWAFGIILGAAAAFGEEPQSAPPDSKPTTAQIRVTLLSAAGMPLRGEGFVVFQGAASSVVIPTKLPAAAAALLSLGSQWTLIADFPDYFAQNSIIQVPRELPQGPMEIQVALRPAGTLTGKFSVDGQEKLPQGLEARFEPTREPTLAKKPDIPAGVAECATGATGDWRCRLPAGRLDIALHPKGFVPHYFWNLSIAAGETASLALQKLVRGASVAGWITREDGTPAVNCQVRLEPASAPGRPYDPTLEFLRKVANEAPCQKGGFFQFSAVRAGSYAIVAQEKDARAQMAPVEVWDGAETRLTAPLVLRQPKDFEVTISPPTDWLGRPWRLEVLRASDYRAGWEEPSYRTEAADDGRARLPKQLPGRFRITAYDQLGNAVYSDSHVDLTDPMVPYPIIIDLLWIEGSIRIGGEPVIGRLFFGGGSGSTSIEMTSNEEGRFEGPLPRPGKWRVDIDASQPQLRTSATVEVRSKNRRATVEIELPDTKVYGRVVEPSGTAAFAADVTLSSAISTIVTKTDENGEFEIRAFPKGATELAASRPALEGTEASDSYIFNASADSAHGPVVLTLRRNRALRGRVLAPTGPVIGATVSAWPTTGGDRTSSNVRSGLDGTFELKVPAGTQAVQAIVSPPGGALKAYEAIVSPDADLLFQVEPLGGELVVDLGKSAPSDGRILAVWQEHLTIPLGILARWTEGHGIRFSSRQGSQIHMTHLAPGRYTVCLGTPEVVASSELEAWKSRAGCASGYVAAGTVLDLRLP